MLLQFHDLFIFLKLGIYTGDVYRILQIPHSHNREGNFVWDKLKTYSDQGRTSIIKTHEGSSMVPPRFDPSKYERAIVLIRCLYNAALAEFYRKRRKKSSDYQEQHPIAEGLSHKCDIALYIVFFYVHCNMVMCFVIS